MYYSQHITAGPASSSQTVTAGPLSHLSQQPTPLLSSGPSCTGPNQSYHHQFYPNGLASPASTQSLNNAHPVLPLPGISIPSPPHEFDTTGQKRPVGMKQAQVSSTLWEDEGSVCYQVEAKGICVARRDDNRMINGTKLLNVVGMTRGRRDGMLKSEKIRHVIKIGPMHLKGVWIPFERALAFANKEKITHLLYPLFVHNIKALVKHKDAAYISGSQARMNQAVATTVRRRELLQNSDPQQYNHQQQHPHQHHLQQQNQQHQQHQQQLLPSIAPAGHSHFSMAPLPPVEHSTSPSQGTMARPALDRVCTFPSASTNGSGLTSEGFGWNSTQSTASSATDSSTGVAGCRSSVPNTPETAPGSNGMQPMRSYSQATQCLDKNRGQYTPPPVHSPMYPGTPSSNKHDASMLTTPASGNYIKSEYVKSDLSLLSSHSMTTASEPADHHDLAKPANGSHHGGHRNRNDHQAADEDQDHEFEADYTHNNDESYDNAQSSYNYSTAPAEHCQMPSESTGSPGRHSAAPGRAIPRTAPPPQPYYRPQGCDFHIPPRGQSSGQVYTSRSSESGPDDRTTGVEDQQHHLAKMNGVAVTSGYSSQSNTMSNSAPVGHKRGRDDDDEHNMHDTNNSEFKRRKPLETAMMPSSYDAMNRAPPTTTMSTRACR